MAIELNEHGTIISLEELAGALGTSADYMKTACDKAGIRILRMNQRKSQQYVALEAIHAYLMVNYDEEERRC